MSFETNKNLHSFDANAAYDEESCLLQDTVDLIQFLCVSENIALLVDIFKKLL